MMYKSLWWVCLSCILSHEVHGSEVYIGSVLNFITPLEEIAPLFERQSGHKLVIYARPMGKTNARTEDNHELDIIMFSDIKSAQTLEAQGGIVNGSRMTYAVGKLALWSNKLNFVDTRGDVLKAGEFAHLALPDPKKNPYGFAAQEVLNRLGVLSTLEPKLLIVENVALSRQQVMNNKAELAFTALSIINLNKRIEGSLWIVPKKLHSSLEQQAVILKNAGNLAAAREFFNYLKSSQARNIIEKYGYSVP